MPLLVAASAAPAIVPAVAVSSVLLLSLLGAHEHHAAFPHVVAHERTLRVTSQHPGERVLVTARGPLVGLEFHCALPRTLYLKKDGKRVAAKMSKSHGNTIGIFEFRQGAPEEGDGNRDTAA